MSDWKCDDMVVCINDTPPEMGWHAGEAPELNKLYTVVEAAPLALYPDIVMLRVAEIRRDPCVLAEYLAASPAHTAPFACDDLGYYAKRFRRVYRPDPEWITRLMDAPIEADETPVPVRVLEPA